MKRQAIYMNRERALGFKRKIMAASNARPAASEPIRPDTNDYQRMIKYLPEPIFVHDGESVIFANQAALKMLESTEAELWAAPLIRTYVHPDFWEMSSKRGTEVLNTDEPNDFMESKLISTTGEIIDVEVSSTRIHGYPGRGMVIQSVYRDIRERKKEEEALIQSEKLSVIGQMAAGIAHEIRNPLTSLIGFSKFLKTRIDNYHDYFDIMLVELDRINTIVQEFMALAKPQANQFRRHDLIKTIQSVLTILETQAIMNNVQLTATYDVDTAELYCEENHLRQVFVNVLKNAIEAMPLGGVVNIALKAAGKDEISISFIDQGIGIPQEQLPLLGGPFFTTKESGTGLGLMVCYRIIEGHHGELDIRSAIGEGTTVEITLPKTLDEDGETA